MTMIAPTADQIQKYLKSVKGAVIMTWLHIGDQEPDPDCVAVQQWLESLANNANDKGQA